MTVNELEKLFKVFMTFPDLQLSYKELNEVAFLEGWSDAECK